MLINNYFVISFLIIMIINLLNFDTHDCNCTPLLFSCNYDLKCCNINIKNGSLYCYDIHIHHWVVGIFGLFFIISLPHNIITSILAGMFSAMAIDGFLFSDRFTV